MNFKNWVSCLLKVLLHIFFGIIENFTASYFQNNWNFQIIKFSEPLLSNFWKTSIPGKERKKKKNPQKKKKKTSSIIEDTIFTMDLWLFWLFMNNVIQNYLSDFKVHHFFEQRKVVSFSPCERKGYRINVGAKEQPIYGETRILSAYDTSTPRKFATCWLALRGFPAKRTSGTKRGREDCQYSMHSSRR